MREIEKDEFFFCSDSGAIEPMVVIMAVFPHVNPVSLKSPCINTVRTQMNAVTQKDLFAIRIENSVIVPILSITIGQMLV